MQESAVLHWERGTQLALTENLNVIKELDEPMDWASSLVIVQKEKMVHCGYVWIPEI